MGYVFQNQKTGKATFNDDSDTTYSLNGINSETNDANLVMGGISYLLWIVGWEAQNVVRVVNQDIVEE